MFTSAVHGLVTFGSTVSCEVSVFGSRAMACFAAAPRASIGNAPQLVRRSTTLGNKTRAPVGGLTRPNTGRSPSTVCNALTPTEIAQIALRDDYDPIIFVFCANALFLSIVLNVLNFGLDRDPTTGDISIPPGGVGEMFERTKDGFLKSFRVPLQRVFMSPELEAAVEELKVAKRSAFLARGTPDAQDTVNAFRAAREKCVRLGLPEDSSLLAAASAEEKP